MFLKYNCSNYTLDISGGALKKFCISTALVILLTYYLSMLVPSNDAKASLLFFTLFGLIPIWLYSRLLLNDSTCTKIFISAYVIKAILGLTHYLTFIDYQYFEHPDSVALTAVVDFGSMFGQIGIYEDAFDFSYKSIIDHANMPHPEIYALMSLFFGNVGHYFLTIIPINLLSTSFVATILSYITKKRQGNYQVVAFLCAFFPMSLISSYFSRDLFALALLSICLGLIIFSKGYIRILLLILASYVLGLQRTPYIVIPILSFIIFRFMKNGKDKGKNKLIIILLCVLIFIFGSDYILGAFEDQDRYTGTTKNIMFYLLFPIRFIQCIIGPFPWTQVLDRPENTFQMQDWFLSASLFYLLFKVFPLYWTDIRAQKPLDYLSIVGMLILLMGVASAEPHLSYVAYGSSFMVPMISRIDFKMKDFISFNIIYFIFMWLFSILWSGLGLGGVSNLFK